jgi:branched-chain amino acid aminotransferase
VARVAPRAFAPRMPLSGRRRAVKSKVLKSSNGPALRSKKSGTAASQKAPVKKAARQTQAKDNGRARTVVTKAAATKAAPSMNGMAAADRPKDHEAFDLNQERPIIYVNGKMLPKSKAMISVYDHGLLYGDGVFEGIRIYKGKIFKLQQHIDRLWRSAERIRLTLPVTPEEMVDIQRRCVAANGIVDGYIRLVITRGVGALGLNPFKCQKAGIVCIADQINLYPPELYETGLKVVVAKRPRIPIACLDPRIKSLNYLNNILAKVEAIDAGCYESIMLNLDGYVSECTGDNIFVVKDGQLFTPPSESGILEGVTRRFVMNDLAHTLGFSVQEKWMKVDEVLSADEIFLTGSAAEIIAVTRVDQTQIGDGSEGKITKQLRQLFRKIVTSDAVPED